MKTIEITVSPKGDTKVETKGFSGTECRQASRFIEEALGQRTPKSSRRSITRPTRPARRSGKHPNLHSKGRTMNESYESTDQFRLIVNIAEAWRTELGFEMDEQPGFDEPAQAGQANRAFCIMARCILQTVGDLPKNSPSS